MVESDWRERRREQRSEERTLKLIYRLQRAVLLTKADAERDGFTYGEQSVPVKALNEFAKWEQARQEEEKEKAKKAK